LSLPNSTLVGEKPVTSGDARGRELTVDVPGRGQQVTVRAFAAKGIVYSAGVSRPKGAQLSDDARKFLDSVAIQTR
jgi:hypothetical protein